MNCLNLVHIDCLQILTIYSFIYLWDIEGYCSMFLGLSVAVRSFSSVVKMHEQVDKVFGPGNQYVTAAKMLLQVCPLYSVGIPFRPALV